MSSLGTSDRPPFPGIDDRLVEPGTPYEMIDGELVHVSPADPPHATRHSKLSALLEAHAGKSFDVASDMLTRTSERSDIAPDASVFPIGPDPVTGGRQLEQLAFQVVSTESFRSAAAKAADLISRGVRRVFAIDVERDRVLEWSPAIHSWSVLDLGGYIEDPALEASLPTEALAHAAKADDAMARALVLKHNPVIEAVRAQDRIEGIAQGRAEGIAQGRAEGRAEGIAQGRAEGIAVGRTESIAQGRAEGVLDTVRELAGMIVAQLEARGFVVADADRARILDETDPAVVARWLVRAATCTDLAEILA